VLVVGQCAPDHAAIANVLMSWFGAEAVAGHTADRALTMLRDRRYALVLINRIIDVDRSPGLDLIRRIRAEADFSGVPVMLVSDVAEAQSEAQAAGAEPGFGKSALHAPATQALLRSYLDTTAIA
jgi:DNA-binding response OmpR family regulator